ncbi:MAG: hypothetical protein Kow0099_29470 [Candidatus Abyssubacteria bacterium]
MSDHPTGPTTPLAAAFAALYELVVHLRSERGCPWDREQTLQSMRSYLHSEAAELGEAIEKGDHKGITEEWGDVLFILLMIAVIAEEAGHFDLAKAMHAVESKMIRRHPHVFGNSGARRVGEVLEQWQKIKQQEKSGETGSLMDEVPHFYSALQRAEQIQKAAAGVGFDWTNRLDILKKIEEETDELRKALAADDSGAAAEELGDLLFSCVNLARFIGFNPKLLLSQTTDKFIERFKYIESQLLHRGKSLDDATLEEMDELWEQYKTHREKAETDCEERDD